MRRDTDSRLSLDAPNLDEATFRLTIAKRLLDVPADDDPWRLREGTIQLEHHLQVAVAWLCLQGLDAELAGFGSADALLEKQLGADRTLLRDGAPYNTLERLVRWLGVAASMNAAGGAAALVPDPTTLVRSALDEIVPGGSQIAMIDLLERTAEIFPWLPHGRLGRAVAAKVHNVPDDSAEHGRCPQCLSLALVRLELEDALDLELGDDARQRVSLSLVGGVTQPVARVARP
jgi:hypothetical protein